MIVILIIFLVLIIVVAFITYFKRREYFDRFRGIAEFVGFIVSLIVALLAFEPN